MQVSYISRHTWIQKADSSVSETQVPHIPQQTDTKQTDMDPVRPTWECPKPMASCILGQTDRQTDRDADKLTPVCPSDRQTGMQTSRLPCAHRTDRPTDRQGCRQADSRVPIGQTDRQTDRDADKPTPVCPSYRQTDRQTGMQTSRLPCAHRTDRPTDRQGCRQTDSRVPIGQTDRNRQTWIQSDRPGSVRNLWHHVFSDRQTDRQTGMQTS